MIDNDFINIQPFKRSKDKTHVNKVKSIKNYQITKKIKRKTKEEVSWHNKILQEIYKL